MRKSYFATKCCLSNLGINLMTFWRRNLFDLDSEPRSTNRVLLSALVTRSYIFLWRPVISLLVDHLNSALLYIARLHVVLWDKIIWFIKCLILFELRNSTFWNISRLYRTDHKQTLKYHLFHIFWPKNISLLQGRRNEKWEKYGKREMKVKWLKPETKTMGRKRERLSRRSA